MHRQQQTLRRVSFSLLVPHFCNFCGASVNFPEAEKKTAHKGLRDELMISPETVYLFWNYFLFVAVCLSAARWLQYLHPSSFCVTAPPTPGCRYMEIGIITRFNHLSRSHEDVAPFIKHGVHCTELIKNWRRSWIKLWLPLLPLFILSPNKVKYITFNGLNKSLNSGHYEGISCKNNLVQTICW